MAQKETAIVDIVVNGVQAKNSIKDLEGASRRLRAELRGMPRDSDDFVEKAKRLKEVNTTLSGIKNEINGTSKAFGVFKNQFISLTTSVVGANLITAAFEKLASVIPNLISGAANLSDELADMRKSTGLSAGEAKELNSQLSRINTRTATKELREIVIVAGQLGIAKKDILAFTEATDKMVVALGDEFQGGAEEVTKVMGGLRNVFTDIKSDKIDQDMLHIGNALNEIGASGAATAPVVADFANRIGGAGIQLGLTSGQVLGLSATLQELNVNTERGGTAVTKILQRMLPHTSEFAKVADMDVNKFNELLNKDLFGAFMKVVEGSNKSASTATKFAKTLDDLGVDGAGASEVLSKLGANTELLTKRVDLSTKSLKETNSIMDEFGIKNETLGAKLEKAWKAITKIMAPLGAVLGVLAEGFANLFDPQDALKQSEAIEKERLALNELVTSINATNVGDEKRKELMAKLQEEYPDFLKNLDAETATNKELTDRLQQVNAEYINRLVIQQNLEEVQKQAEETAKKKAVALEAERQLNQALTKVYEKNNKLMEENAGLSIDIQAELTVANSGLSIHNDKLIKVQKTYEKYKDAQIALSAEKLKLNDIDKKRQEIEELLGITSKKSGDDQVEATKKSGDALVEISKEQQKFIENTRKLNDELAALKATMIADDLERELAAMEAKLQHKKHDIQKEAADEKVKHDLIRTLEEKHQQDVAALKLKYQEESNDRSFQNSTKMLAEWHAYEKLKITQARAEGLLTKEQTEQAEALLEKEYFGHKLAAAKQHGKSTTEVEQQIADQKIKLAENNQKKENDRLLASKELAVLKTKEGTQERFEAEKEYLFAKMEIELATTAKSEEEKEVIREKFRQQMLEADQKAVTQGMQAYANAFQEFGNFYSNFTSSINQAENNRENAEINREQRIVDEKKKALKDEYDEKLKHAKNNTKAKEKLEEEYKLKVEGLDEALDKKKRKIAHDQAVRQKEQARVNAIINGISAIMRIAADVPKFDFGVGTALLIAAQAGMTAAQLGEIESTEVPEYGDGSYLVKGAQTGKTYNATYGGVLAGGMYSSPTLALVGETAKPEYVIPGWMMEIASVANTAGALEAIRVNKQYAAGGSTGASVTPMPVQGTSTSTDPMVLELMMQVKQSLDRLNNNLENPIPIRANVVYADIEEVRTTIDNLRSEAAA